MTENTQNAIALTSTEVQTRIDDERRRLLIEQNMEADLTGQRIAPLEAGDDVALDRVEQQLNQCRERQFRIQERIELLEVRRSAAIDAEASAELDSLATRAERAREYGERLIADYARRAPELAALLGRLAAVDQVIEQANRTLHAADRASIVSPNGVRCRAGRRWTEKVMRDVDLQHPSHPFHGRATPMGGSSMPGNTVPRMASVHGDQGRTCPVVMNVEVEEQRRGPGDFPDPIYETARLPGVGPALPGHGIASLWDGDASAEDVAAVIAEIDGKPNAKPAKRAA